MEMNRRQQFTQSAWGEFDRARSKARTSKLISRFSKGSDDLPAFAQIREIVKPDGECYAGCKTIPVDKIVGSEDRSSDFNKDFMPRKKFMRNRWCSVAAAFYMGTTLPPIQVLELGGVYFIRDGNHRVSVARSKKVAFIDAEVTRLSSETQFESATELVELAAAAKAVASKGSAA